MKPAFVASLLATAVLGITSSAQAAGGCGQGYHRGGNGGCYPNYAPGYAPGYVPTYAPGYVPGYVPNNVPNYGPGNGYPDGGFVAPQAVVPEIGMFYPGRGYWNGNGYYLHRRHRHGGWQYW